MFALSIEFNEAVDLSSRLKGVMVGPTQQSTEHLPTHWSNNSHGNIIGLPTAVYAI